MSYEVIWEPEALAQAERFAKDDPQGVRQVFTAVDRIADEPRPEGAFGSTDVLRIHGSATSRSASACSTSAACAEHCRRGGLCVRPPPSAMLGQPRWILFKSSSVIVGGCLARHPRQDLRIWARVVPTDTGGGGVLAVGVNEVVDVPGQVRAVHPSREEHRNEQRRRHQPADQATPTSQPMP
ncbi:hypothetical protein [Streptomyces sp. NPDC000880]